MRVRLRSLAPPRSRVEEPPGRSSTAHDQYAVPDQRDETAGPDPFERRMRESDGPVDLAHYGCDCGFQFTARVATTVRCPHCGAGQAW